MKKFYSVVLLFIASSFALNAQMVDVTISVDMSNEEVSADGVHVAGSFQGWDPSGTELTDADNDGVYDVVLTVDQDSTYEYKFVNGNNWDSAESIPSDCLTNGNRSILVGAENLATEMVCYSSCEACVQLTGETIDVTFVLDMNTQAISSDGVHVAGAFQEWDPATTALTDDNSDGIYEVTLSLDQGATYEYKFINGNTWGADESVSGDCGNGNRQLTTAMESAMVLDQVCFASCEACPEVEQTVIFRVDMSLSTVSPLGIHIAGSFQGWDPAATELTDEDGDNIYEVTVTGIADGEYQYKFVNGDAWGDDEVLSGLECDSDGNRTFTVSTGTTIVGPFCYEQCGSCEMPVNVTFKVDMSNETVSPNGVHIAGDLQGWDPAATELLDEDGDNIYEVVLELNAGTYNFKYINGNAWDGDGNDNESVGAECNVGGNREASFNTDTIVQFCYNQCEANCVAYPDAAEITFVVDMNDVVSVEASGVWIIGSFTSPQWQDGRVQMFEHADYTGVYTATIMVEGPADIQYKFSNGEPVLESPFQDGESYDFVTDGCGSENGIGGFNRNFIRTGMSEYAGTFCYNTCSNCNSVDLSAEELEGANSFYVYPNPAHTVLMLSQESNYQVFNILGEEILRGGGQSIDVSSIKAGVYFVQSEDLKLTVRFIKN